MHKSLLGRLRAHRNLLAQLALLISWAAGVLAGFCLFRSDEQVFVSLMCGSFRCTVSIVMLLAGILLPGLITAYVVYMNKFHILYPLCFVKALCYSLAAASVYGTYSGGWLMHGFLLLTESISLWLLLAIWIRILSRREISRISVLTCCSIAFAVFGIDMAFVAPFVESFISL